MCMNTQTRFGKQKIDAFGILLVNIRLINRILTVLTELSLSLLNIKLALESRQVLDQKRRMQKKDLYMK